MLASLGTVFLVYRCAGLLGRNPLAAAVIVGINPIVLVWGMGGDHNDFLMLFFLVLGFWLLLRANAMRVGKRARPAPARARPVWWRAAPRLGVARRHAETARRRRAGPVDGGRRGRRARRRGGDQGLLGRADPDRAGGRSAAGA